MSNIEVGKTYNGTVKSVRNFGAFVECIEGVEGLVHISELDNCRIDKIDDFCSVGDIMTVKCIGIDDHGRVRLSRRAVICEEQGLPYEVREVKAKKRFGGREGEGRSFGQKRFGNNYHSGYRDNNRPFGGGQGGGGGFGRSRRPPSGNSGFSRGY
ncbi:MAG: S1 RNA-binding domain-containing protein [Puniceicoccales bacterium]|jgi:polyribonucleotide nucleotidyltransferase|nr:S1 RNA-binding domain-containing protein [Puniceicoccales bacterium]